jgi:hypothetical protein
MSLAGVRKKPGGELTSRQLALLFVLGPVVWLAMLASLGTPISGGNADRQNALAFLQKILPEHRLVPTEESSSPIAAVFHVIRSGDPESALQAIHFADVYRLGYAFPYVIGRLGSGDPALEEAARRYLRNIAGVDYGGNAAAWRAWWRNPPRNILGLVIGEQTFALGFPTLVVITGVLLIRFGNRRSLPRASFIGGVLLVLSWFNLFMLGGTRLMAKHNTCMLGSTPISYFSSKGTVLGLEDARLAGSWFVFVLLAAFVTGPSFLNPYVICVLIGRPKHFLIVSATFAKLVR